MKHVKKEVQIALVAIAGIVVLYFGLQFLKGMSLVSDEDVYYAAFDDISGLAPSSAIYASGYQVGVVQSINFDYDGTGGCVAALGLDKRFRLMSGTTAAIESDMLGNVKVNLVPSSDGGEQLSPGDTIKGGQEKGVLGKAAEMLPTIERMLPKLDSIVGSLNALLADSAMTGTLHNVETVTANLTTTTAEMNTLLASLNRDVPGMMGKADAVLDNAGQITENLSRVDFAATIAKADATLENVRLMTERLSNAEGTLGLLVNDAALYDNLNATMRSADSLLLDLKEHPKRYVHFSLFGRKDK